MAVFLRTFLVRPPSVGAECFSVSRRTLRSIAGRFTGPDNRPSINRKLDEELGQWTPVSITSDEKQQPQQEQQEKSVFRALSCNPDVDPEFLESFGPLAPPSFNLAAYANRSHTIQQLVKLGVDLSKIEADRGVAHFAIHADFDLHIKDHIRWLVDFGIEPDELGAFITEYPRVFEETLERLQQRVDYFKSKKFRRQQIVKMVKEYPPLLKKSFIEVDSILGFIQKEYQLKGYQVRSMLIEYPKLVSLEPMQIRLQTFALKEDIGFEKGQIRHVVMTVPSILGQHRQEMVNIFDHLHSKNNISHELVLKFPEVLVGGFQTVKNRLAYLKVLKRDQFDPAEPLFVPLTCLSHGSDLAFAEKFARTSLDDYDLFLRNL